MNTPRYNEKGVNFYDLSSKNAPRELGKRDLA